MPGPVPVVEGDVYPASRKKGYAWLTLGLGTIAAGVFLILCLQAYILGLIVAASSLAWFDMFVRSIMTGQRLILGKRFLQVVKWRDKVVVQIAYDNIDTLICDDFNKSGEKDIGLVIKNKNDPTTFWLELANPLRINLFNQTTAPEIDMALNDAYSLPIEKVAEEIRARCPQYQQDGNP